MHAHIYSVHYLDILLQLLLYYLVQYTCHTILCSSLFKAEIIWLLNSLQAFLVGNKQIGEEPILKKN